jgi:hypothetical protein
LRADLTNMVASGRAYLLQEFLPELVAQLRRQITGEISEAVGGLRADMNVARAIDRNEVVELPNVLRKTS